MYFLARDWCVSIEKILRVDETDLIAERDNCIECELMIQVIVHWV